jgi:hypothetical protein
VLRFLSSHRLKPGGWPVAMRTRFCGEAGNSWAGIFTFAGRPW